ncbi:MAG: hypothetical protein ACMXYB_02830 [Candidatus Woesearchaeota archaeon]
MDIKQVNIAIPKNLYVKIEEYVNNYGYRNAQDLFLELARQRVFFNENESKKELKEEFIREMLEIKENKKVDFSSIEELESLIKNA